MKKLFRFLPAALCLPLLPLLLSAAPATPNPGLKYYYPVPAADPALTIEADICVYGGTPGGVAAAVQSARMGKKAVLIVFRRHVGGMTSGGLTATDIGNRKAIGGFANEVYAHIGKTSGFKPSQAEDAFIHFLQQAGVTVYYEHRLKDVIKEGNRITTLTFENGNSAKAKMFVDATYEGDLFAKAGVSFHVGREANATYNETINGIQFRNAHNFNIPVDPYHTPGAPNSGLLPTISSADPGKPGEGDTKIQAYNFRFNLSNAGTRIPFPKPEGYDRNRYLVYLRYAQASTTKPIIPFQLHNGDCNNTGGFSTDHIGANYAWPEGDYTTREKIFQDHVNYQQGLAWFAAHDPEVPDNIRALVNQYGLLNGEFPETNGWPHELYVREGRRMISDYVMTEHECTSQKIPEDPIGLAAYTMDSHNCQRVVIDGKIRNEGDVQVRVPQPYSISYRSIIPKEAECSNLLVSVCLSSSHIAYGSIRMEPVFMILGQSAATAASMAIDENTSVQKVAYPQLKKRLLADSQILTWEGGPTRTVIADTIPKGIEVNYTQASKTGDWIESASGNYLHDNDEAKGTKTITFTPDLPADGNYDIYLRWLKHGNRATNVPIELQYPNDSRSLTINQRTQGGWIKITNGTFKAGKQTTLTITTKDTNGHVVADAIRFVPVQ
ncbi:FAD-dependent oxidoreductase [Phragmitibacter flavus]|uniref:FAD-dependent oxidoreductase n=2 Tax=Phragmitibacter flavus TaxID=2576071 RepID=A0A5R8K8H6_9BACT|nr:FAD-dependent oxidoreductase [Phragmitibacter flavus]